MSALLSWLVATATVAAPAPEPAVGPPGSVDAIVHAVVARHPALAAKRTAADTARIQASQADHAWYPQLSADAWYRYSQPLPQLSIDTGLTLPGQTEPVKIDRELGSPHSAGAQVTVGWRAWDNGARTALARAARAGARASLAEADQQAAELAYGARAAYLAALFFDDVVAATDRALNTARASRDQAQKKVDVGLGAKVQVAAGDARLADLQARRDEAAANAAQARDTLRVLLGLPEDAPLELSDTLETLTAPADAPPDIPRLELRASDHPLLRRLDAAESAVDAQGDAVSAGRWPTIDLFARGGYQYPVTFVEEDPGFFAVAGVSLTWKLWDGGITGLREDEIASRRRELELTADAAREDIRRQEIEADAKAETATANLAAAERRIAAAQVYLDAARGGLSGGLATALDVQQAEDQLDAARLSLVKARFDAAMAHAQALRAAGSTGTPPAPEVLP